MHVDTVVMQVRIAVDPSQQLGTFPLIEYKKDDISVKMKV